MIQQVSDQPRITSNQPITFRPAAYYENGTAIARLWLDCKEYSRLTITDFGATLRVYSDGVQLTSVISQSTTERVYDISSYDKCDLITYNPNVLGINYGIKLE